MPPELDSAALLRTGFWLTLEIVVIGFALAIAVGIVIASFRVSPIPPLRGIATAFVEYFRGTPLIVLVLIAFFGLPKIGLRFSGFQCGVLALGLYTGAFVAEAVRSGFNAVGKGQVEAARSLGLTFPQTLRLIVVPQALRTVIPPLANLLSAAVRNSAVVAAIAVPDLAYQSERIITEQANALVIAVVVAGLYLLMTIPIGVAANVLERKLAIKR